MSSNRDYTVVHKKSSVVNNGVPKLPSASTLEYGEIAINYGASGETLSIKNSNDQIVTFSSDNKRDAAVDALQGDIERIDSAITEIEEVFDENELVVSTALGNLNDRLENVENAGYITGFTETDPTVPAWAKEQNKPSYSASEVGAMATSERSNYLPTGTTLDNVADGSTRKLANYSLTSHTHTASEVDAMATSERSNYLTTASTLDSVADGTTRKLANYSLTSHTHGIYSTTAHTHTAAEVGAISTADTGNFMTTAATLDNVADGSTRKLANYSLTSHTHTANEVGAMAASERGNYLTTATTIPNVDNYFDDVEYDSNSKRINFKHGNTVKDYIDATDFIKDGMVDTVAIATPTGGTNSGVTCLVVTFNTDAGKSDIEIPLSSIFDASNYYTKTDADDKFMTISAYTEDEEVIAAALNDLDSRIENFYVPHYTSELTNDSGFVTSGETDDIWSEFNNYSTTAHTHNQYSLTSHTHTASEVGAMATSERNNYLTTASTLDSVADGTTRKLANYSLTSHTHSQYSTTAHTHTAAEVGAMATSERSNYSTTAHTHSDYATTAHTHTASEVGAMATSERSNYLPTGTTLDNVADGSTRKLSNYSTTAHTHTAAQVGAMSTSERSNYSTTAHTHSEYLTTGTTAEDIGAMSQDEWGVLKVGCNIIQDGMPITSIYGPVNFSELNIVNHADWSGLVRAEQFDSDGLPISGVSLQSDLDSKASTAHTHDQYSLTSHTHNQYATTAHTHTASEVGAMATSERSNYSTTAHTHSQYISGLTFNGTAVTVTNGVAAITGQTLPTVTSADNGKVMMVVEGAWALVTPTTVYTGGSTPLSSVGNDGDIYLQTN